LPLSPEPQAPNQLDTLFEGSSLTAGDALIRKTIIFAKLAEAAATVETPNPRKPKFAKTKPETPENETRNSKPEP
jgi:hypothetical protein